MTADDRASSLLVAEADLTSSIDTMVRVLGRERGAEVARAIVDERLAAIEARQRTVIALAREDHAAWDR